LPSGDPSRSLSSRSTQAEPAADIDLAPFTTLGIGGRARWFVRADTPADVARAHAWARDQDVPMFVLGGGSNLVVADRGVDALVVHIAIRGVAFREDAAATRIEIGAGERWDPVVAAAVDRGLAGLECLSGIPGTVGGTPIQNVGAYGQEVADTIESVLAYDTRNGAVRVLGADECGFAYRMSRFKREDANRFVVCGVTFRLAAGPPTATYPDIVRQLERAGLSVPTLHDVRRTVLDVRRGKGMVVDADDSESRSVGSFFMNPIVPAAVRERLASRAGVEPPAFDIGSGRVKVPAAWLIERAGFQRGHADGAVGISRKHTLALVNREGATARDVLRLASRIKRAVLDRFGVALRPEPVFVGFENDPELMFLQAESDAS
jgi:UDP-N-acetylmuramate dehydrogenase